MKTIGILINPEKAEIAHPLSRMRAEADRLSARLVTCQEIAAVQIERLDQAVFAKSIDALITLGGDGTLLRAVRLLPEVSIPVLGINLGRMGFLTSATEDQIEESLRALCAGNFHISHRVLLDGSIRDAGGRDRGSFRALNDLVVGWGQSTRIVTLDVSINGEPVTSYRCDGIIVSTPTGSTGHSLSAGGPIVHPASGSLVLNVICPHTLSARPLVIPDDALITIAVRQTGKELLLSVDGRDDASLHDGDTLMIRKAPQRFQLVHLNGYSYYGVLRQKLQWSGSSA